MILSSEEDDGCNDVGVVGNELSVKTHKAKDGAYSLDRGWCYDPFSSLLYSALYPYSSFTYLER